MFVKYFWYFFETKSQVRTCFETNENTKYLFQNTSSFYFCLKKYQKCLRTLYTIPNQKQLFIKVHSIIKSNVLIDPLLL